MTDIILREVSAFFCFLSDNFHRRHRCGNRLLGCLRPLPEEDESVAQRKRSDYRRQLQRRPSGAGTEHVLRRGGGGAGEEGRIGRQNVRHLFRHHPAEGQQAGTDLRHPAQLQPLLLLHVHPQVAPEQGVRTGGGQGVSGMQDGIR